MTSNDDMPETIWCQHTDSRGEHLQRWWSSPDWPHNTTQYTRTDTLNQQAASPAPVEPSAEADEDNFEYLLWCIKEQIKLYAPHILKFWQWQEFEATLSASQPAPAAPADQDAVRELVESVKALYWEDTVTDLDGTVEEWGGFTDQDGKDRLFAALARLEGE